MHNVVEMSTQPMTTTQMDVFDFIFWTVIIIASIALIIAIIDKIIEIRKETKEQCEEDEKYIHMSAKYFQDLCFPHINQSVSNEFTPPDNEHLLIKFFARGISLYFESARGEEIISTRKTVKTIVAIWEPDGVRVTLRLENCTYEETTTHERFAHQLKNILKNEYVIRVPSMFEKT